MSFKCFCTPSTVCSGCDPMMVERLGQGSSIYHGFDSLPKIPFSSVLASQEPHLPVQQSDEQIYGEQQVHHNQQIGQISMAVSKPTTVQPQRMSTMQPSLTTRSLYVPGNCTKRFTQYMHQLNGNANTSIEYWREVVSEFFAPTAKKRWCFSLCKNRSQPSAPFAQREWHCQVCEQKPVSGYEVTAKMLPTLSRVGHETGILQELLYADLPSEHSRMSGEIAVRFDKATVTLVYQNLRVAQDGRLCIVFTCDLKIISWDFCIRNVEQLISGRSLVPQLDKLDFFTWKYNRAVNSTSSSSRSSELKRHSQELVETASEIQKALNVPEVTDVGYTKRFLRFIEMSEGFTCMTDLLDHSVATGMSPRMSLAGFGDSSNKDRAANSYRKGKRPLVQAPNEGQTDA